MNLYGRILIEKFSYVLILLGALNCGAVGVFKFNLINYLSEHVVDIPSLNRILYIMIGCAGLLFVFNRDYYLPFLGKTVYPCNSLSIKTPVNANIATQIKTKPNVNVIFWASETNEDQIMESPWKAYNMYSNSGVALSDANGIATLKVRNPSSYKIPSGKKLSPHVHYRVCTSGGMLSGIKTAFIY